MFLHDVIKIKYISLGYLPNIPYHLISDEEMFSAFHNAESPHDCFFYNEYPPMPATDEERGNIDPKSPVPSKYAVLLDKIYRTILLYQDGEIQQLPDWIYSYMLGAVVGPHSDKRDIHDVIAPLGVDNPDDDYGDDASIKCYQESEEYLRKTLPANSPDSRPPTMFGEPHVIKSLRLKKQLL